MAEQNDSWMSIPDIAKALGASEFSVAKAVESLGLSSKAQRDIRDRRRIVYPPESLERIKEWLVKP